MSRFFSRCTYGHVVEHGLPGSIDFEEVVLVRGFELVDVAAVSARLQKVLSKVVFPARAALGLADFGPQFIVGVAELASG